MIFIRVIWSIPTLNLNEVATKEDLVLIGPSGAKGSMSLINQCIKNTIHYIFDPGFILTQANDTDLTKGVSHADYIIGNDYEIDLIQNRVKNWDKISKQCVVIKTLGSKGSEIFDHGKKIKILPAKVKKIIDPTGAGDAWRSGFIAGLERNFDLKTSAQMGSVAASFAVEAYGTQEHTYTIEEFNNRYRHTYKNLLDL
jgi:adenosine kinase